MDSDLRPSPVNLSRLYLAQLDQIAKDDVEALEKAEKSYGDSWKKRGGIGAFMMLARKWDRIERALSPGDGDSGPTQEAQMVSQCKEHVRPYDILQGIESDKRAEGLIDDIRDLRRYLMLVEAEARAQGHLHDEVQKD